MNTICFVGEDPAVVTAAANAAMVGKVVSSRHERLADSYEFARAAVGDLAPDRGSFQTSGATTNAVYSITIDYT